VLEEGQVSAGDPVEVLARPATAVTIADSVRAYYGDEGLMRRLLLVEDRSSKWDEIAESVLGRVTGAGAGLGGTGTPGA
jgi:MOSC domain-containing protein YiiM